MNEIFHAHGSLSLERCAVVGIVNRTPDSFYDGGRMDLDASLRYSMSLVEDGADVLDVGAVKAGPGRPVGESEEAERLIPLIEAIARETDVAMSVETGRPAIARAAIASGAAILNDVTGLADRELARVCADTGAALIVMHHGGQIRGRPRHPRYEDVVTDVLMTWDELARTAQEAGVSADRIICDPGLDFGKTTFHSLEVMRRLDELVAQGRPVLVAPSRKDVVGETLGLEPSQRLEGTLALVALSVMGGASAVRVHDVRASVRVVRMIEAVMGRARPEAPVRGLWD
jgi:dihydropteroate synthase